MSVVIKVRKEEGVSSLLSFSPYTIRNLQCDKLGQTLHALRATYMIFFLGKRQRRVVPKIERKK